MQLLTKYVPNIFQEAPTPHSIEEAIRRSMASLKVIAMCVNSLVSCCERSNSIPEAWPPHVLPKLCGDAMCVIETGQAHQT